MLLKLIGKIFSKPAKSEPQTITVKGRTKSNLVEAEYLIERGEDDLFYKEWLDEQGTVVDSVLQDRNGDVADQELIKAVRVKVDEWAKAN